MKVWHHQIHQARNRQQLMQLARDYIASLSPDEWSSVSPACRPDRIKGIDDLEFWHRRLADAYLGIASTTEGNEMLRDMLAFFTTAAERANELHGEIPSPDADTIDDASRPGRAVNRQSAE